MNRIENGTYLESERHPASNFAVHLRFFQNLVVLVRARLPYVDYSPGKTMLQTLDCFKVNIESNGLNKRSLGLLYDHIQYVY